MFSISTPHRKPGAAANVLFGLAALTTAPVALGQALTLSPIPVPYQSQIDPQMLQVLEVYGALAGTPITALKPTDARQQFSAADAAKAVARASGVQLAPEPVASVVDMNIPGPDATMLPIRVYTPSGSGNFPVVLYFHGGGFVIATIDTYDASARALANLSKAIIVSVEYRKAPEHPYPAAFNDATTAYAWLLTNAASLGGDPNRVAVAGESAGGNLAATVCLYARENGMKMPVYQLLVYPVVSASVQFASAHTYETAIPLSRAALSYFYGYWLAPGTSSAGGYVSPLNADLHGLPPATIIGAQIDPLQSEGELYAAKLTASGVKTHYVLYPGVTHEFFGMGAVVSKALAAEQTAGSDLQSAFTR